ncbi:endonuclease iii [hydrocarbon metagenome]|uniref:Endonuclease iii n=1 Tax=hydrocarbon metagenome TaxID=938273 RepID=A0A0W8FXV6_9ZZZZ
MDAKSKLIKEVNKLLIDKFGIPPRNKLLPNPVDMLIATILSQNTNDNNSYKAFKNLKEKYPTWEEAAEAKRSSIESVIKVAGLGKQKSAAIKNFLTDVQLKQKKISLDYLKNLDENSAIEKLINYNGVGVKTASCVLLFSMDRNICPVDTHVHRTVNRIGIVSGKTPDKTFVLLNENFPPQIAHSFHTNLIRLGREICKPKNPSCGICPINKICKYDEKDLQIKKMHKKNDFMLLDNIETEYAEK